MDWKQKLRQILSEHCDVNGLKALCSSLNIEWEDLKGTQLSQKIESLISHIDDHRLEISLSEAGNSDNITAYNIGHIIGDLRITVNQSQQNSTTSAKQPQQNKSLRPKSNEPNPFMAGQPAVQKYFFGREEILRRLFNLWNAYPEKPVENAAIWGEKGVGKTSLLLHIKKLVTDKPSRLRSEQIEQKKQWLSRSKQYCFIYVNFQDKRKQNPKGFLSYLLNEMELNQCGDLSDSDDYLSNFIDIVSDNLKKPTIIMLDEIDKIIKDKRKRFDIDLWESFRSLATTEFEVPRLSFLLSSLEKPSELMKLDEINEDIVSSRFLNLFGSEIEIKPFSEMEARALIESSPKPFPEKVVTSIINGSLKPCDLQNICHEKYESF